MTEKAEEGEEEECEEVDENRKGRKEWEDHFMEKCCQGRLESRMLIVDLAQG